MKKILVTIAALFLSAAAWAQYQGTTWGSDPEFFKMQKGLTPNKTQSGYKYCTEKKLMLGQSSELFYIFENNKLSGISYAVDYSPETEKKLLDNLSGFKFKRELLTEGEKAVKQENKVKIKNIIAEQLKSYTLEILYTEDVLGSQKGAGSLISDFVSKPGDFPQENKIYKYNFQDHTQIFIFVNIYFNDKIVVVYVPQTEDF